jgi:hypothetical protein
MTHCLIAIISRDKLDSIRRHIACVLGTWITMVFFSFFKQTLNATSARGLKIIGIYIYTSYIQNVSGIDNNMTWTLNVKILSNPLHRNGHTAGYVQHTSDKTISYQI